MRDLLELFCFVRSKGDHTHQAMQTIGAFSSTLAVTTDIHGCSSGYSSALC